MIGIENETQFENYIRSEILEKIIAKNPNLKLFNFKKAVDILIAKNGENPELFFIEIKYHKLRHGRLGIGHQNGGGFQPEVIKFKVDYFEKNMFWILGNEESEDFWLVKNESIRNYISGFTIGEKFNNIQKRLFREEQSLTEAELFRKLELWFS